MASGAVFILNVGAIARARPETGWAPSQKNRNVCRWTSSRSSSSDRPFGRSAPTPAAFRGANRGRCRSCKCSPVLYPLIISQAQPVSAEMSMARGVFRDGKPRAGSGIGSRDQVAGFSPQAGGDVAEGDQALLLLVPKGKLDAAQAFPKRQPAYRGQGWMGRAELREAGKRECGCSGGET